MKRGIDTRVAYITMELERVTKAEVKASENFSENQWFFTLKFEDLNISLRFGAPTADILNEHLEDVPPRLAQQASNLMLGTYFWKGK